MHVAHLVAKCPVFGRTSPYSGHFIVTKTAHIATPKVKGVAICNYCYCTSGSFFSCCLVSMIPVRAARKSEFQGVIDCKRKLLCYRCMIIIIVDVY